MVSRVNMNKPEKSLQELWAEILDLQTMVYGRSSSVTNGQTRFAGNESLLVQGSQKVEGWLVVTGTERVTGTLEILGRLVASGAIEFTGPTSITGDTDITGRLTSSGAVVLNGPTRIAGTAEITGETTIGGPTRVAGLMTLDSDLAVRDGRVLVGPLILDRGGAYGGRLISTGNVLYLGAGTTVAIGAEYLSAQKGSFTDVEAFSLEVSGSKNFRMPHPTKPGSWLRHGATESPVSGTEYTGRARLDNDGAAVVELPDYFEALNKPENRTIQITPIGRPFAVGAEEIEDGKFTAYGDAGRDVFWLVKAERYGGDFLLEETMPEAPQSLLN